MALSGKDQGLAPSEKFSLFYEYTLKQLKADYLTEILNYSHDKWEAPTRAARLAAAVKRYKTSKMLLFILQLNEREQADLTPALVKHLCFGLFGRKGSQAIIVDVFSKPGRRVKSDDCNKFKINELVANWLEPAVIYWAGVLADIDKIKSLYQEEITKKNAKGGIH